MKLKIALVALGLMVASALPAAAATFRFAFQGDLKSLDPYSLNESFTLGMLSNVYEGLTRRGKNLEIIPGLAERWEVVEPTRWRFYLRKGVKFQNGEDFTADDVVFSAERVRASGSDLRTRIQPDTKVVKVDDYTVDFVLSAPNPILHYEWDTWYILSKKWAEANNSVMPQPASGQQAIYAALHANGTGPFVIAEHQAGVRTVFKPNPKWWDKPEHNFDEVVLTPIGNDATRVAAATRERLRRGLPGARPWCVEHPMRKETAMIRTLFETDGGTTALILRLALGAVRTWPAAESAPGPGPAGAAGSTPPSRRASTRVP